MASSNQTPDVLFSPIAANADASDINTIPQTYDPSNYGYAAQNVGFPTECRLPVLNPDGTLGQGRAPRMQDWNGIMKLVSSHNFFLQNGGSYTFNPTVSVNLGGYPKNTILWYFPENEDPCLVYSLINDNTNNFVDDPTLIDGEHWKKLSLGGAGGEIGDMGFAPLGIDESLNLRRYLNGQVISQTQFVSFTTKVKSAVALFPSLATTEANWQAEKLLSKFGQVGKFVIDDVNNTIRLPAVVNPQGLLGLSGIGNLVSESLPNITGYLEGACTGDVDYQPTGVFTGTTRYEVNPFSTTTTGNYKRGGLVFNASQSSSVYQDNAPVQQEAVQYPYYIQVATGVEETLPAIREYKVNNSDFFGKSMYSDVAPNNASWLASNGSYNARTVYQDYYDWLLEKRNSRFTTFYGLNNALSGDLEALIPSSSVAVNDLVYTRLNSTAAIVLGYVTAISGTQISYHNNANGATGTLVLDTSHTENLYKYSNTTPNILLQEEASNWPSSLPNTTDYDFIVNQNDQTFRLPLLNGDRVLVKKYVNGTDWYNLYSDGWCEQGGHYTNSGSSYQTKTISFLKEFIDTNYNFQKTIGGTTNVFGESTYGLLGYIEGSKNTSSINVQFYGQGFDTVVDWKACGYTSIPTQSDFTEVAGLYYYVGDTVQDASLINAGAVLGQLSNKADIDASNFNASGKSLLSGLGMPSGRYTDLTLLASGQSYTAPGNGYFVMYGETNAANGFVYFVGGGMNPKFYCPPSGGVASGFCPAKKGQTFRIDYANINTNSVNTALSFVYAVGEN